MAMLNNQMVIMIEGKVCFWKASTEIIAVYGENEYGQKSCNMLKFARFRKYQKMKCRNPNAEKGIPYRSSSCRVLRPAANPKIAHEEPHREPPLFVPLQLKEIIPQSQSLRDSVTKTTGFTYLGVKESNLYILLPIMCANGPVLMDMICSTLLLPTMILNQSNKPAWCILGLQ